MKFVRIEQHLYKASTSGRYYLIWKQHGKKERLSLKTKDYQLARRRLRDKLDKVRQWDRSKSKLTFIQVADEWKQTVLAAKDLKPKAHLDQLTCLNAVLKAWPALKTERIGNLTLTDCERWKAKRKGEISSQRFNNELGVFKQIFAFAVRENILLDNPAASITRLKIINKPVLCPERAQFVAIVQ